jgi:hypothetical protein
MLVYGRADGVPKSLASMDICGICCIVERFKSPGNGRF